jgi:hypothetical protein
MLKRRNTRLWSPCSSLVAASWRSVIRMPQPDLILNLFHRTVEIEAAGGGAQIVTWKWRIVLSLAT